MKALAGVPYLAPWAFEFTPASSEAAEDTYLAKVHGADLFIWLIGTETTRPVELEVGEALSAKLRMIAIKLGTQTRNKKTQDLILRVQAHCKWASASSEEELRSALSLSLSDEIVRAIRRRPTLSRVARLDEIGRASRARCVARWEGAGLDATLAIEMAGVPDIGAVPPHVAPSREEPHRVLVGEVGTGKSLAAERMLQSAITAAQESVATPVPVYLPATKAVPDVEAAIVTFAEGLGEPTRDGVILVIDGLDEVDEAAALRLLERSRALVRTWPCSTALVTSRQLPFLVNKGDTVRMPELGASETMALVSRVAGREIAPVASHGWPEPIRESVKRPLFAILLGIAIRVNGYAPSTPGELIAQLVSHLLPGLGVEGFEALTRLAILSTDRGGAPVRASSLGGIRALLESRSTRLVTAEAATLAFPLPILAQWFAAQALLDSKVTIEELTNDPSRLEKWRYPLAVFAARAGSEQIDPLFTHLTENDPSFASRVLDDGAREFYGDDGDGRQEPTPSSAQAAARLRAAYETWDTALTPAAEMLLPRKMDHSLATVAATAHDDSLMHGWHTGPQDLGTSTIFPDDVNILRPKEHWHPRSLGRTHWPPTWPWSRSRDEVRNELTRVVSSRQLHTDSHWHTKEALYLFACLVHRHGGLFDPEFDSKPVVVALRRIKTDLLATKWGVFEVPALCQSIDALCLDGHATITSPWPRSDNSNGSGFMGNQYSPPRALARVNAVYQAAIDTYRPLCDRWFPNLKHRMRIYVLLPARLVGEFRPGDKHTGGMATLHWHLEPLIAGETSRVEIENGPPTDGTVELQELHSIIVARRPQAAGWLGAILHRGVAEDVFAPDPLHQILYSWLAADLKAATLIK
ncbi:MAG: hypothetical protein ACKVUT_15360 [Gaiella sp.]